MDLLIFLAIIVLLVVVIFGTVIGEILNETGGASRIADSIIRILGPKRLPLAMG